MTDEERNRLELALRVIARVDKISELNEAEFRLLGYNHEYENHSGWMVFQEPFPFYASKAEIRERCVNVVMSHIAKEDEIA
jgi:hypothetical protein